MRKSIFSRPQATDPPYVHRTRLEQDARRAVAREVRKLCIFDGATRGCGVTRLLRESWQTELSEQKRREVVAPIDMQHVETGVSPQVMADIATRLIRDADALGYDGKRHFREFAAAFLIFTVRFYADDKEELKELLEWPKTSGERTRERWAKLGVRFATLGLADAIDLAGVVLGGQSDSLVDQVSRYLVDFVDGELTGRATSEIEDRLYNKLLAGSFNSAREHGVDASVTATVLCEQTFEDSLSEFLHGLRQSKLGLGAVIILDHVDSSIRPGGVEPDLSDAGQRAAWVDWAGSCHLAEECEKALASVLAIVAQSPADEPKLRATLGNRGDQTPLAAEIEQIGMSQYAVGPLASDRVEYRLGNPPDGTELVAARVWKRLKDNGLLPEHGHILPAELAAVWASEVGEL